MSNTVNGDAVRDVISAGEGMSAQTREKIAELGIDARKLDKTYPVDVWVACVKLIAADRFPDLGVCTRSLRGLDQRRH